MNISKKLRLFITVFTLISSCQWVTAASLNYPVAPQNFLYNYWYSASTEYFKITQLADEICDNGIDDDGDGLIDAFDDDCLCILPVDTMNIVPNGNFEETTGCCASLDNINCLENWIMTGPSPDYVSDNCPNADLRPDVRALSNSFNTTFNEGYIFSLFSQVNGAFYNETMGVCLSEPMVAGNTYILSFDMGNLRNEAPDILFAIFGINDCNQLSNYKTQIRNAFCDSGLPYVHLGAVNTLTLNNGWNNYEFEVTPPTDIEAIFYSTDCDYQPSSIVNLDLYLVLDNIKIQRKINTALDNEILVEGSPCEEKLRFTVQGAEELPIHWFKDSIALIRTTGGSLIFGSEMLEEAAGTYHAKVTFEDGECQLVGPLVYNLERDTSEETLTLCEGETYQFGTFTVTAPGKYTQTLVTTNGCDSIAIILVNYQDAIHRSISETIVEGEFYFFNEENISTSGAYLDTLLNVNGCDTIITLNLMIESIVEDCDNGIDDDGDGLIDIFDKDCQCIQVIDTMNLVPNGDFELSEPNCCTRSTEGESICIDSWTHKSTTPDFIHPNCIGITSPGEISLFNVPIQGGFMGVIIRHLVNFLSDPLLESLEGMTSETIGLCLSEPLIAGKAYTISLDVSLKGKQQSGELMEEAFFIVNGVPECDSLPKYIPETGFCELGLPYEPLASVNLFTLASLGWNHFEFEFTPSTNLEAIFVTGDCNLVTQNLVSEIVLFDNLKIQKKEDANNQNEITVESNPCSEIFRLFVDLEQNTTYQWYRDSIPIIGATKNYLIQLPSVDIINGIYQLSIIDNNGNCQLLTKEINEPLELFSEEIITLCEGESYQIGTTIINTVGEHRFTETLTTNSGVCDSIVTVFVTILPSLSYSYSDTINATDTYLFGGDFFSTAGVFRDTISSLEKCDSIIMLTLFVRPTSSFSFLVENICQGETLSFGGETLTNPGDYMDTLINSAGGDSIIILNLRVIPISIFSFVEELCVGETYLFGDTLLTTSGQYVQNFKTLTFGCDSIARLTINFLETVQGDTLFVSQFQGTTYTFYGETYSESGIFEATLSAGSGCDSIAYLNLIFTDPCAIPFNINIESADTDCETANNGWLELLVEGGALPYRFSIDNGLNFSEDPLFENLSVGNYELIIIDKNACESKSQVSIEIGTSDLFVRLPNDTSLYKGQSIQLAVEEINFDPITYNWSSEASINCPNCLSVRLNPTVSGIHSLIVTDENGCEISDEINIEIKKVPQLYIPNAFSPNSDGNNDYFTIQGNQEALNRVEELHIYNRWGNRIFYGQNTNKQATLEWDGFSQNKKAMAGVYLYIIKWTNPQGNLELLKGDFTLFR